MTSDVRARGDRTGGTAGGPTPIADNGVHTKIITREMPSA